jgi:anti-sigma regulatory factor (Ser/Thr protein kinase)
MEMKQTSGTGRPGGSALIAECRFRADDLPDVRALVSAQASRAGAHQGQVDALVVVANELATNAIMHGGGSGRMRLWRGADHIVCEVVDCGHGLNPGAAGMQRPSIKSASGRGLWLVRRIADAVEIDSGTGGTAVAARMALQTRRATCTGAAAHRN